MTSNYLKIAWRQLRKQKMYAAVKVGGFALGIAACLLIGLYIRDEMGHDRSYPDAERIFRLVGDGQLDWGLDWPEPLAKAVLKDFPEIAHSGRFRYEGNKEIRRADKTQNSYEQHIVYVDQAFLDAFQLPTVAGDGHSALNEPSTMVITKTMADKYYPGENPVGQVMYVDDDKTQPHRISAVVDIPTNSHLHPFNFYLTLTGKDFGDNDNWSWYNYWVYVKLKPGANPAQLEKKITADLVKNYLLPQFIKEGSKNAEKDSKKISFHLQPVVDINLHAAEMSAGLPHSDIRFIWLFGSIAIFILVIKKGPRLLPPQSH
jgi:putative ABC transport system permease protein